MKTITSVKSILAGALLALSCVGASANTLDISLVYTGEHDVNDDGVIVAALGDTLVFDLNIDSSNRPTLGGGFDINFDPDVFSFESYSYSGSGIPIFHRTPDIEYGRLFSGGYGVRYNEPVATIATLTFTLIGLGPASITPSGTFGVTGPWVDRVDFVSIIDPNYSGVTVRAVPVPAAVWLLMSAVGVLAGMGRRKIA